MAERRMFAKTIIDSDAFLEMPLSSQALYFHLSMRADDEGFINNPKKIQRMIGGTEDDLKLLIAKSFIIPFESGIVVVKHWRIHNYIQNDRFKPTVYTDERAMLSVKGNNAYTLDTQCIQNGYKMDTPCIQDVSEVDTQVSIGKDSIGKDNNIVSDTSDAIKQIIDHLNKVTGARYTTRSKSTNKLIKARLQEGHTVDDFISVIDKKYAQWGRDQKMARYLRPETLFNASHFESYLNEIEAKPKTYFGTEREYDYAELEAIAKGGKRV